ncbi:hypothetical protein Hanom_Chr17g01575411 [Helianthus anomalus]
MPVVVQWHDSGFRSEPRRFVLGFGPTWVSAWDGFRIATGFGPTQVSARDEFWVVTSFVPF